MRRTGHRRAAHSAREYAALKLGLSALTVFGLLLASGCSTLAEADDGKESKAGTPGTKPAITTATACEALTEPSSLAFNAPRDFEKGAISAEERDAQLVDAKRLFTEIEAPSGRIQTALDALNTYLEAAPPGADGSPFDAEAFEYANLQSTLGQSCEAAGEELIIEGHGG